MKNAVKNKGVENLLGLDIVLIFEALQDYYDKDEELTRISQLGDNLIETFIRSNKKEEKEIRDYIRKKRIELTKLFVDNFDDVLNQIK